jgi:hypothetical protein
LRIEQEGGVAALPHWGASGLAGGKLQRAAAVQGGMESGEAGDFLGLIGVKGG